MATHPDSDRIATTPEELRRLVIDGVLWAALELHGEVDDLRTVARDLLARVRRGRGEHGEALLDPETAARIEAVLK